MLIDWDFDGQFDPEDIAISLAMTEAVEEEDNEDDENC